MKKAHRTENQPNQLLPGYYHVSVSPGGQFRSTLQYPGTKKEERGGISARQKRKLRKVRNRRPADDAFFKEGRETAD